MRLEMRSQKAEVRLHAISVLIRDVFVVQIFDSCF